MLKFFMFFFHLFSHIKMLYEKTENRIYIISPLIIGPFDLRSNSPINTTLHYDQFHFDYFAEGTPHYKLLYNNYIS